MQPIEEKFGSQDVRNLAGVVSATGNIRAGSHCPIDVQNCATRWPSASGTTQGDVDSNDFVLEYRTNGK